MVISHLTNEELISLTNARTNTTEIQKELVKRLSVYEDDSTFLNRVEEAKEELNHKKNMFIVCSSAIFLKKELPDNFHYMPNNKVLDHIKEHVYGDYKNFAAEYIYNQLQELAKKFISKI